MAKRDIVVIGASAGGVYALRDLAAALPANLAASLFVVVHVAPHSPSYLPEILNHAGPLKAVHPDDGDLIQQGRIYVAPPDHHLLIESGRVLVKKGPKENRFRPSIDALFRSAAYTYGSRVIGVVLTGMLDDGTSGLWSVKRLDGLGIIQQPDDALYPSMPSSVLQHVTVDYQVPLAELAPLLSRLTEETAPPLPSVAPTEQQRLRTEVGIAAQQNAFELGILELGELTPLTCPECSGSLVRLNEGRLTRYRCHTGHAFTAATLLADITKSVEESLWKAVRGLEEATLLLEQEAGQQTESGNTGAAQTYTRQAKEVRSRAARLRETIFQQEQLSTAAPDPLFPQET